ncbi:MAG TPA: glycosyltransferase family 2 protein [Kofleriaceae bacterium]|nr:glycosyltransferase family 2 protein [Kofleriaceae bacterium]
MTRAIARPSSRACIATTVRHPGPPLFSFLRYHLAIGFAEIYVFFDDPDDPAADGASALPGVTAVRCDDAVRAWQRASAPAFARMEAFLTREVMARQVLNAELALHLAARRGMDWLLHIDIDELFHSQEPVAHHFASIPETVGQVVYLNCEAFPEAADMDDYFRDVTLFKKNPVTCRRGAIAAWLEGAGRPWYFLAYDNGKAAVRVAPGVTAHSVHVFDLTATGGQTITTVEPAILHYVNCGIEYYVRKYEQRGAFSDRYFESAPRLPFHLRSRDVVRTGDRRAIREFYARHVVCGGPVEADAMIAAGVGLRVTAPRVLLSGAAPALAAGGAR